MAEKQKAQQVEEPVKPSARKKNLMVGGVLLGIMMLEGGLVFVLAKSFGAGPATAEAGQNGLDPKEGAQAPLTTELELVSIRAQNDKSQRRMVYDFTVWASITDKQKEGFTKLLAVRKATIGDRFSSVIRAADPQWFVEPDLTTIREQFKQELDKITGEELKVEKVLIPSMNSYVEN